MITLGNHALRWYMTWLLMTLTWLPVTLTWLLYNLQVWRYGRWFRKFTVRFWPIRIELESSMYNNRDYLACVFDFILFVILPLICHKKNPIDVIKILVCLCLYHTVCFAVAVQINSGVSPVFKVLFTLCLAFITRFVLVDWLLIYHIGDSIDFSWCLD